ncbi:MAG: aspartate--tRNA ligase [Oscillospiraceae bacterium]|jgi:aspartyl-tRNA synthetase|nr:aspartate--tRNA ligase [Oscillospiraceae bacterium]
MAVVDEMGTLRRTHYCADVSDADVGAEIVVCGFVQKVRNIGNLLFIDLRDRTGILQLAFDEETPESVFAKAETVRSEFVLMTKGTLKKRISINEELSTGRVELFVNELKILSRAATTPFEIKDDVNAREELRLKYRYLDLRRKELMDGLIFRNEVTYLIRDYFKKNGFLEIETPILIRSTPEGARDYLVPSRVHPGRFFALPQSPQLYKQILMVAGFDRYIQIAKCFRDEDLRADRQPEFTQIDLEMSFVDELDVMAVNEGFVAQLFEKMLGIKLERPFARLTYKEAMERFGVDKPDTRFGLELVDLAEGLKQTEFMVFKNAIKAGGYVKAINVKGAAAELTRKEIDKLTEFVKTYGAKGLAYTRLFDVETSSYEKFLTDEEKQYVRERAGVTDGDVILIVADENPKVVSDALGNLRVHLGSKLELTKKGSFDVLWVTEFPLLEFDEETKRYVTMHHPFTAPNPQDVDLLELDPSKVRARAYDLVINGSEVGGGSIRISDLRLQKRMFSLLGMGEEEVESKFGFLLEAFSFGVPPHGGIAYGLDRLVMLMLGKSSIRDVIAFPKVQNSGELMSSCPSEVDKKSLDELKISVDFSGGEGEF